MTRFIRNILLVFVLAALIFGGGRLYYIVTGGFTIGNMSSKLSYDERFDTQPLSENEKQIIGTALDQEYTYLGKGCQAYVFASQDGNYVIKFFKYQRFRTQPWISLFTFIPPVEKYLQAKTEIKLACLHNVFKSWKVAYEHLKDETGVLYVHLNKTDEWKRKMTIRDKMGIAHQIDLDQVEFLLQKRATMLSEEIDTFVSEGKSDEAKQLIDRLLTMIHSEYIRGYADNDHALMQNTGVIAGNPVHIDVGQFICNDIVKNPKVFKQEIFNKTFRFRTWLKKHHPELAVHLEQRLIAIIGMDYFCMAPYVYKGNVGKIPHQNSRVTLETAVETSR